MLDWAISAIGEINTVIGMAAGLLLSAGIIIARLGAVRRWITAHVEGRIDTLGEAVTEVGGRLDDVEQALQNVVTRQDLRRLHDDMDRMSGRIGSIEQALAASVERDRAQLDAITAVRQQITVLTEALLRREQRGEG